MVTYKLHILRHGLTAMNMAGRYMGQTDEPLCAHGVEDIRQKLRSHAYPKAQTLYCCPLLRCRETAELIYPGLPLTVVEDLTEMAMGDFEGRTFEELRFDPLFESWMNDAVGNTPPGGESAAAFSARISDGLGAVFMDMQAERIRSAACVVSGGVMMSLLKQHTRSEEPLSAFSAQPGEGYTIALSTHLWASHRLIEITGKIPDAK